MFPSGTIEPIRERVSVEVEEDAALSIEVRGVQIQASLVGKDYVGRSTGTEYRAKDASSPNKWDLSVESKDGPQSKGDMTTEITIDRRTGHMTFRRSFSSRLHGGRTMYTDAVGVCEAGPSRNKF